MGETTGGLQHKGDGQGLSMDRTLFENGRVKREMLEPGDVSQLIGVST